MPKYLNMNIIVSKQVKRDDSFNIVFFQIIYFDRVDQK